MESVMILTAHHLVLHTVEIVEHTHTQRGMGNTLKTENSARNRYISARRYTKSIANKLDDI